MKLLDITSLIDGVVTAFSTNNPNYNLMPYFNSSEINEWDPENYLITVKFFTRRAVPKWLNKPSLGGSQSNFSRQGDVGILFFKMNKVTKDFQLLTYKIYYDDSSERLTIEDKIKKAGTIYSLSTSSPTGKYLNLRYAKEGDILVAKMDILESNTYTNTIILSEPSGFNVCLDKQIEPLYKRAFFPLSTFESGYSVLFYNMVNNIEPPISGQQYFTFTSQNNQMVCSNIINIINTINFGNLAKFYTVNGAETINIDFSSNITRFDPSTFIGIGTLKVATNKILPNTPLHTFYKNVIKIKDGDKICLFFYFVMGLDFSIISATPFIHLNYYDSSCTTPTSIFVENNNVISVFNVMEKNIVLLEIPIAELYPEFKSEEYLAFNSGGIFKEINKGSITLPELTLSQQAQQQALQQAQQQALQQAQQQALQQAQQAQQQAQQALQQAQQQALQQAQQQALTPTAEDYIMAMQRMRQDLKRK